MGPVSLNQESSWGQGTTVMFSRGSMLSAFLTCTETDAANSCHCMDEPPHCMDKPPQN